MSSDPFEPESGSQSSSLASNIRASMMTCRTFSGLISNIVPSCFSVDRHRLRSELGLAEDSNLPALGQTDRPDALEFTERAADGFERQSEIVRHVLAAQFDLDRFAVIGARFARKLEQEIRHPLLRALAAQRDQMLMRRKRQTLPNVSRAESPSFSVCSEAAAERNGGNFDETA